MFLTVWGSGLFSREGNWILIEVNDGSMSGLSENDPDTLYFELKKGIHSLGSGL